jgi:hypothetical protein
MQRWTITLCSVAAVAGGCATSSTVGSVAARHADATFEATAQGCDRTRRTTVRQFTDLRSAVAWGRATAALAPNRSCDVLVEALRNGAREDVYRVSRDARGIWTIAPVASR